jgi:hypothetical protein
VQAPTKFELVINLKTAKARSALRCLRCCSPAPTRVLESRFAAIAHGRYWHKAAGGNVRFRAAVGAITDVTRRLFYQPCFATRLGGVSGGRETQGWRDSSHTAMVGAGKLGSAKLPMATATYPGKPSPSQ